jgi:hypothetical protein
MLFNIDLTQVQDIKPLPAGTYVFKVVDVDGSKVSKQGNPKLVIKCEIIAPKKVAEKQKFFWMQLSLVDTALFKVKQFVEMCNLPIKSTGFNTADFLNRMFGAVVTEEDSKEFGHRNQVASFLKATDPTLKPEVDAAAFARFEESLKPSTPEAAPIPLEIKVGAPLTSSL